MLFVYVTVSLAVDGSRFLAVTFTISTFTKFQSWVNPDPS